ncbi:hypothetical protein ACTFIU_007579 [Dictyostelium citrinum]
MTEILRYCQGIMQRGIKESIRTLYYTGELKFGKLVGVDKVGNSNSSGCNSNNSCNCCNCCSCNSNSNSNNNCNNNSNSNNNSNKEIYGRHRWVEYADYKSNDPTTIPPEYHSWIHHVSDKLPSEMLPFSPTYKRPHIANPTGTDGAYTPPNFLFNIEKSKEELQKEEKNDNKQ